MPAGQRPERTVAVSGASGLVGAALSEALCARGDQVVHLVRREPRARAETGPQVREVRWDPVEPLDPSALDGVDGVVHLAGAGIADHRWTPEHKARIRSSRVEGTSTLAAAVAGTGRRVRMVSGSAVGFYGSRGSDVLTEDSHGGEGFLAEVCRDWEAATWQAEQAGAPVAHVRTGIVLAAKGGALGKLVPFAKVGLAGPLGSGQQFWAWITLRDHVRALLFLLDHSEITGPVNLTSPNPDTQAAVVKALGDQLHRPTGLPAPTIALKLALGQMAEDILGSQRVVPTVLQEHGFGFEHPDLQSAMDWLFPERKEQAADAGKDDPALERTNES